MAIDLPAPIEPQRYEGSVATFRQQADAATTLSFGRYRIHALGDTGLAAEQHAAVIADAQSLSDAVRAIAVAHYLAGRPATQLRYLLVGEDLYIAATEAPIRAVQGHPELARYFEPLLGREQLNAADLEPARALASIEADRRGVSAQMRLAADEQGLTLAIDETAVEPQVLGARFNVGNPGNRYAGREFAEAEVRLSSGALEWTGSQRSGLRADGDYGEQSVAVSWIAPQGLFGFSARTARYTLAEQDGAYEGRARHLGLQWSLLPYADFSTRWLLTLRADASDDRLADRSGTVLFDERFDSLGADLSRARVWGADDAASTQLQLALSFDAGRGTTRGDPGLVGADSAFFAVRPRLDINHDRDGWGATLAVSGQFSADRLPQQQQLVLGGGRNLSAWLPGVGVGDRGALARAQLGAAPLDAGVRLQPFVFVEAACWERNGIDDPTAGDDCLADAGAELTLEAGQWLQASVTAALPLPDQDDRQARYDDARADAYFSVTLRY